MLIEITDRDEWLEKVDTILLWIKSERTRRDAEYETEWLKGHTGHLWWRKQRTGKPPVEQGLYFPRYPSSFGWNRAPELNLIAIALRSNGTGTVSLSEDDFNMITTNYQKATK